MGIFNKNKVVIYPDTAKTADTIRRNLSKLDSLSVAPPLVMQKGNGSVTLGYETASLPFWALVSGSSSPYSWKEEKRTANAGWNQCCRTGSGNAYEVNNVLGLNNTYQYLVPDNLGGYRFEAIKTGSTAPPCNTSLVIAIYGCYSVNYQTYQSQYTDLGSKGTVTVTTPSGKTYTGSGTQNSPLYVPMLQPGSYSVQASGDGYFSRSYTFTYNKCDGHNYGVGMVLTPKQVSFAGSICNYPHGAVNISVSGAWSGSGTSTGTGNDVMSVSGPVDANQKYTLTGTHDRYVTESFDLETYAPSIPSDNPSYPYNTYVGGTISCYPLIVNLTPESCYSCWNACEYPVFNYCQVNTPIGSVIVRTFNGSGTLYYTTNAQDSCCLRTTSDQSIPFIISSSGIVQYHTCDYHNPNFNAPCGGLPAVQDHCPNYGSTGSNAGRRPSNYAENCIENVQMPCPPGVIETFDVVEAGILNGNYTITEFGCSPYSTMAVAPHEVSPTYLVIPQKKAEKSSKRQKWNEKS